MLTEKQLSWVQEKTGWYLDPQAVKPVLSVACVNALFALGQNYSGVEIDVHGGNIRAYCRNQMGEGHDIIEATEKLVERLCPTPDPDPYLTEQLIDAVAPGKYPSWADKVAAAETISKAQADEFLAHIDLS